MNKEICLDDYINIIIEKLNSGGTVTFTPSGKSMQPMLRDGEDVVVLSKKQDGRLHLFDVPLYKRKNGTYVLHRVVGFTEDGAYIMCGDNQFELEKGIKDEDIIAVVTAFFRKGKSYSMQSLKYKLYVNFWYYSKIFRQSYSYCKNKSIKIIKKGLKK